MAPIQHLGNIDKRKRASQQVAFGFFSFLSYLVVVILFVILGFIILKLGFPDTSTPRGHDLRGDFSGYRRYTLFSDRK